MPPDLKRERGQSEEFRGPLGHPTKQFLSNITKYMHSCVTIQFRVYIRFCTVQVYIVSMCLYMNFIDIYMFKYICIVVIGTCTLCVHVLHISMLSMYNIIILGTIQYCSIVRHTLN